MNKKLEKFLDMTNLNNYRIAKTSKLTNEEKTEICKAILSKYNILDDNYAGEKHERREMILSRLSALIIEGDTQFLHVYEKFLSHTGGMELYVAIEGYAKSLKEKSLDKLIEIVFNKTLQMEYRVYALYELCIYSGQRFIEKIPYLDIREWPESYLHLDKITTWIKGGKPINLNNNQSTPNFDADNPVSKLLKTINKKYYKDINFFSRSEIAIGKHMIYVPQKDDVVLVTTSWNFPNDYNYYLKNYVVNTELKGSTILFSAENLKDNQYGFAIDPITQKSIDGWNPNHIVIATRGGDLMFCISLDKSDYGTIYKFYHDEWKFKKIASDFTEFLTSIV